MELSFCSFLLVALFGTIVNLFIASEVESSSFLNDILSEKWTTIIATIVFVGLYIPETICGYKIDEYCEKITDMNNRTTYMIEMPNNISCEGTYWSGKNQPISVKCVDGSFHVVNGIEVKYKLIDHKRSE